MKSSKLLNLLILTLLILGALPLLATASPPEPQLTQIASPAEVADLVGGVEPAAPPAPEGTGPTWTYPEAVLWDNGPLVTHPGGGAGGADASALQTALGMGIYGFGHQLSLGYRIADEFEITDPSGWDIDTITFFAYQTGSPTSPSPINHVNYQIWDGPPDDPGSSVVFGDTTTNRLVNSVWSNIYRVLDTSLLDTNRPIMADTCSAGVHLDPGTYWLDWQTGGTLASGPWAPPVTILGQTTTGNGMQSLDGGATWAALVDVGPQGLPFIIEGTGAATLHVGDIRMRERDFGFGRTALAVVPILDDSGALMPGALVSGEWTWPNGHVVSRQRYTNPGSGYANFRQLALPDGAYQFCVTDVSLAGYVYDPSQNVETCDSITFP